MNMTKIARLAALIVGLPALISTAQAAGGISGSVHDFSAKTWNSRKGTCSTCHSAHHTDSAQTVPLWNHANTTSALAPYASPSMDATVATGGPFGATLACLSCHDGTVAINQGASGLLGTEAEMIDSGAVIDHLNVTHPVAFTYDAALATADGELENPDTYKIGDAKTGLTVTTAPVPTSWAGTSLTGKTIKDGLMNGSNVMHCSTCHDVHRMSGSSATSGILAKLSSTDADGRGSTLCRTCHKK
jgi:Zn-finger protein